MPSDIPQSDALAEATTDSLSELFSRDPFGLSRIEFSRQIEALRAQRVKWEASDQAKPQRAAKAAVKSLVASANAEDLGL